MPCSDWAHLALTREKPPVFVGHIPGEVDINRQFQGFLLLHTSRLGKKGERRPSQLLVLQVGLPLPLTTLQSWEPHGAEQWNPGHPPRDPLASRDFSCTSSWPLDLVIMNSHTKTEISTVCILVFEISFLWLLWDFQFIKMTVSSPSSVYHIITFLLTQLRVHGLSLYSSPCKHC